jgi:O-antigen/teichoic acid export membrane protein
VQQFDRFGKFAGYSLISIGENVALLSGKFLLILVILVVLGPTSQGSFALFLTIQTAALTIAAFGLEPALMYWGSRTSNAAVHRALFGNSLLTALISGMVAACIVYVLSVLGAFNDSFSTTERVLLATAVLLGTTALVLSGLLGGIGRFDIRFLGVAAQNGIAVGATLLAIAFGMASLQLILLLWVVGLSVNVTIWIVALYSLTGGLALSGPWARRQLRTASQTYGYLILSLAAMRIDVFIVSHLLGLNALGFYSIATAAAELLLYLPKSMANPVLARSADPSTAFPYSEIFRSLSALLALAVALCALLGPLTLVTLFGNEMTQVATLLLLLLPGTYLLGLGTTAAYALFGLHEMQRPLVAAATATVTKVALALALIPVLGLGGAAVATSVAYTVFTYIVLGGIAPKVGMSPAMLATPDFVSLVRRFTGLVRSLHLK